MANPLDVRVGLWHPVRMGGGEYGTLPVCMLLPAMEDAEREEEGSRAIEGRSEGVEGYIT